MVVCVRLCVGACVGGRGGEKGVRVCVLGCVFVCVYACLCFVAYTLIPESIRCRRESWCWVAGEGCQRVTKGEGSVLMFDLIIDNIITVIH